MQARASTISWCGMLKDVPRTHVFRLLRKGEVRVNKKRARPDQRVMLGDIVRIPPVRRSEELPPPAAPRVASSSLQKLVLDAIVHEDADLFVFNKPSGVAVHGGSATDFGLIEALRGRPPRRARRRTGPPPRPRDERLPARGQAPGGAARPASAAA